MLGFIELFFSAVGIYGFFIQNLTCVCIGLAVIIICDVIDVFINGHNPTTIIIAIILATGVSIANKEALYSFAIILCGESFVMSILTLILTTIAFIKNKTNINSKEIKEKSMKYYNFFTKYILTIIVIINIIAIIANIQYVQATQDYTVGISILINIILHVIIPIQLKDKLTLKEKSGYIFIIIFFILDYIYNIIVASGNMCMNNCDGKFITYMIIFTIIYSVWYIPNLIYFIKRKEIFANK